MAAGDLIWADLSTFDVAKARLFYSRAFGWSFDDAGRYFIARGPLAGLYEMPETFRRIRMPSFWMSYIEVPNADQAARVAIDQGGKVEVGPEDQAGLGRFALLRDPLGAGFTVLERPTVRSSGRRNHALIVSSAAAVQPFYTALFGWEYVPKHAGVWQITSGGGAVAELHEIPDPAVRGKEEYWAIAFPASAKTVAKAGAGRIADLQLVAGPATLWRDDQGAAFLTCEAEVDRPLAMSRNNPPYLAWVGLGLIVLSLLPDMAWIWAVFLAAWVVVGLRDRATYLLQPVTRAESPILFWALMGSYTFLAVFALWGLV